MDLLMESAMFFTAVSTSGRTYKDHKLFIMYIKVKILHTVMLRIKLLTYISKCNFWHYLSPFSSLARMVCSIELFRLFRYRGWDKALWIVCKVILWILWICVKWPLDSVRSLRIIFLFYRYCIMQRNSVILPEINPKPSNHNFFCKQLIFSFVFV